MRLPIFAFLVALNTPALPAFAETEEPLLQAIFNEKNTEVTRQVIAAAYVANIAEDLRGASVKIKDPERFARLLPRDVTEPVLETFKENVAGQCLQKLTPAQRSLIVDIVIKPEENRAAADNLAGEAWSLLACILGETHEAGRQIRESGEMPQPAAFPALSEILQMDGIASFPNRIARRDVLKDWEERAADQP